MWMSPSGLTVCEDFTILNIIQTMQNIGSITVGKCEAVFLAKRQPNHIQYSLVSQIVSSNLTIYGSIDN